MEGEEGERQGEEGEDRVTQVRDRCGSGEWRRKQRSQPGFKAKHVNRGSN